MTHKRSSDTEPNENVPNETSDDLPTNQFNNAATFAAEVKLQRNAQGLEAKSKDLADANKVVAIAVGGESLRGGTFANRQAIFDNKERGASPCTIQI
ncbi:unnamed protein product, partial [Iphiclides podalirius]